MRVVHCPQHIGQHVLPNMEALRSLHPRLAGGTEMDLGRHDFIGVMRHALGSGYRVLTRQVGGPASHSREIPIAYRVTAWWEIESFDVEQISPDLGPGIANDRYYALLRLRNRVRHSRRYFYLITHTDAAIQDLATGAVNHSDRAQATGKAMAEIEAVVDHLINVEGRAGFVTGDFNYKQVGQHFRLTDAQLWEHSPQKMFARLGMKYHQDGLDYLAWVGMTLRHLRTIPQGHVVTPGHINQADHPWLVGDFSRTPTKSRWLSRWRRKGKHQ